MVFGVFRRAVSVIGELISFGRAEEAQLDKLIERGSRKLEMVKKLNEEADEAFAKLQVDMLKQGVDDMEAVQAVIQKHEVMLAASFKDIFGDLSDDGSINSEKIRKLAKKLGENVTPGEIKKMAKELAAANLEDFGIVETNSEDIRTLTKELSQNATVEQITKVAREIDAANPDEVGNTDNSRRR